MAIYQFLNFIPVVHETAFVHPQANVTGDVVIGPKCYVGPGAVLRGDWGRIVLEEGVNVQENCTVHMFPGTETRLKKMAHVGHGAIIHGGTLEENVLIGMNAVVMDHCTVGAGSIVGALAFVPQNTVVPERSIFVGNPGRVVKQVSDEMLAWKTEGTELYMELAQQCIDTVKEVEPLRELEADRPTHKGTYQTHK
ncbi:MAG: transferase hexapeptide repeat family protein [Schleiferiaceae bacterium]|jgi:phenylacetic acid degradation protein